MSQNNLIADIQPGRQKSKLPQWLKTTVRWCWIILSVIATGVALLAANGGKFNPAEWPFPAILAMSFPIVIWGLIITALVNIRYNKWLSLIQWVCMLFCVGGLNNYLPLNLFKSHEVAPEDEGRVLRVMTYNTFGFNDDEGIYPDDTNRTASAIIESGADLVFVQEIGFIDDMPSRHLSSAQVDSLAERYPFSMFNEHKMVGILSRYPLEWVELPQPESSYAGFEGVKLKVNGVEMLAVSVHLQSLGLNEEDKLVYHNITSGEGPGGWKEAGRIIYDKIADAMVARASQARMLREALDSIAIPNVLVAGDFNDINGCYAMRTICGDNLHSTFTDVGRGATVTYHKDRFLFNIDHILYGGDIKPVDIRTGRVLSSDHYPVYATFLVGE